MSRSTNAAGHGRRALAGTEAALADVHQKPVNLIQGQHGSRRIIDRRRQRLVGNVHHDAKGKTWVLLHRPLGANGDTGPQRADLDGTTAAANAKQRIAPGHEVPNLRHQFDYHLSTFGNRHQAPPVKRQHDARSPNVLNYRSVAFRRRRPALLLVGRIEWLGVDALHHGASFTRHCLEDRNRPQRCTEPLDEPEKDGDAHQVADDGKRNWQLRCRVVNSARGGDGIRVGKGEGAEDPFEASVRENHGDDARSQLAWPVARRSKATTRRTLQKSASKT